MTTAVPGLDFSLDTLRIYREASKRLAGALARLDLMVSEYEALVWIRDAEKPARPSDLAGGIGITKSGVTRLMARLSQRGLVSRVSSAVDHRELYLELTPLGTSLSLIHI